MTGKRPENEAKQTDRFETLAGHWPAWSKTFLLPESTRDAKLLGGQSDGT